MSDEISFTIHENGASSPRALHITGLVIAGWTGRDPVARDKHIAELEELGIARPASTPIYYRVAARRLTTATAIECSGGESSGEVEFVLVKSGGKLYVGVGSDHTDRKVETYNITASKQMCDKPLASELWAFEDVAAHWDQLMLRSFATIDGARVLYQEGALTGMLPVADLIMREFGDGGMPDNVAMFGGTFAAIGGIRPATRFDYELHDPVRGLTIRHGYSISSLPVLG